MRIIDPLYRLRAFHLASQAFNIASQVDIHPMLLQDRLICVSNRLVSFGFAS
jgi:hypothetical protein